MVAGVAEGCPRVGCAFLIVVAGVAGGRVVSYSRNGQSHQRVAEL